MLILVSVSLMFICYDLVLNDLWTCALIANVSTCITKSVSCSRFIQNKTMHCRCYLHLAYILCVHLYCFRYINIVHHVHKADMFIVVTFRLDVHTPDIHEPLTCFGVSVCLPFSIHNW